MSIYNNFKDYKDEIELALKQNAGVEIELYSIIACIIREGGNGFLISLRDVTQRKRSYISKGFYGDSGFPDFMILERSKRNDAKILGCIEAKAVYKELDDKTFRQINGHVKSFTKVLYTNGVVWRYYNGKTEPEWSCELGKYNNGEIDWNNGDECWDDLLKRLDTINWACDK